ncbi:MAG: DUF4197 domain-containing protein [Bacteroidetes bacterium]|nr:DUF4197 domain-containing protein [Bacteroidota bacterium]
MTSKIIALFFILAVVGVSCTKDDVNSVINTTQDNVSDSEIVAGLRTALVVSTDTSVKQTNVMDGYFKNLAIKIPFPPNAQRVLDALRTNILTKYVCESYIDKVVLTLNRAAEDAAIEAKPIFIDAVKKMSITDGKNILFGDSLAATTYLNSKTYAQLKTLYKPKIEASLNKVNATTYWKDLTTLYNTIASDTVNTDLTDYSTNKALDGLFYMVGKEEKDIRRDPAARVDAILKKVFGQLDHK